MKKICCLVFLFALVSLNVNQVKANDEMEVFCSNDVNSAGIVNEVNSMRLHSTSDEYLEKGTINTIYVNETVHVDLAKSGCYGDAYFTVSGTYDIEFDGSRFDVISHNLDVEIDSFTAEWDVILDRPTYTLNSDSVTVLIRYSFLQPYFDCPIGGGYMSDATTVVV